MNFQFNPITNSLDLVVIPSQPLSQGDSPTFSAIYTDSLQEKTLNNGVSVAGVILKEGGMILSNQLAFNGGQADYSLGGGLVSGDVLTLGTAVSSVYIPGGVTISGALYVQGDTVEVNSQITTTDTLVVLNQGEVAAGVTAGIAGFQVDRGILTDYQFIFDESVDQFRIGQLGQTQAVATRENNPVNTGIPFWNNTDNRLDSTASLTWNGSTLSAANLSLTTPLTLANGGTGASTTATAASNLGLGTSNAVQHARLGLGVTPDANAPLTIQNATPPSASVTDCVLIYAADRGGTAGKSGLHIRSENNTSHVFADRIGLGTTTPAYDLQVVGMNQNVIGNPADINSFSDIYLQSVNDGGGGFILYSRSSCNTTVQDVTKYIRVSTQFTDDLGILSTGSTTKLAFCTGLAKADTPYDANNLRLGIDTAGNVGIGTLTFGTSAANVLALSNGIQGGDSADKIQLTSEDLSPGNTTLSVRTEGGDSLVASSSNSVTHKIAVRWNGTTYYLLASTSPT